MVFFLRLHSLIKSTIIVRGIDRTNRQDQLNISNMKGRTINFGHVVGISLVLNKRGKEKK